jgi:hypothetical protein
MGLTGRVPMYECPCIREALSVGSIFADTRRLEDCDLSPQIRTQRRRALLAIYHDGEQVQGLIEV